MKWMRLSAGEDALFRNCFWQYCFAAWSLILLCLGQATFGVEPPYPPIPVWSPDANQREHLRRSLTLMQSSSPSDRKTVRVLFYGQSITQQAWWKEVESYLRTTYPNANFVIENRAIGGHAAQLLVKTAEADLYPFQPDLLIFHVYGSHVDYENIIKRTCERTCADILLQTDHITTEASLAEETDPTKLSPKQWDAWMNQAFLPTTADKYNACRADIHELWKKYLKANNLKPADLLKDTVHLNSHGEWLMAELLKPYLAPLPPEANYDPMNEPRVHTIAPTFSADDTPYRFEFSGTRVDLVFKAATQQPPVSVLIDGTPPSKIPSLYGMTRVSAFPGSDWPMLLGVHSTAPLRAEEWSATLSQMSDNGKVCHFAVSGSMTGPDGEGWSTNRFVTHSGRIVIEPEDWNLGFCYAVFKRPLPDLYVAHWKTVLRGADQPTPPEPALASGVAPCTTVAQGLTPGRHVLELKGHALKSALHAIRVYSPAGSSQGSTR